VKIEAVVTCVNYSDFLSHSLAFNRHAFDRLVVVTAPGDLATRRACEFWDVLCLATDAFTRDGAPFSKGRGINVGLDALDRDGWVVHLDADVALPPTAGRVLRSAPLDPRGLYGLDRLMCRGFAQWAEFVAAPQPMHDLGIFVHPGPFPVGARVARPDGGGYLPLGYWQLWHPGISGISDYPEGHPTAASDDLAFALRWPRERRHLLPDLFCYHLESAPAPMGANWNGRTTPWFGPDPALPWLRPGADAEADAELVTPLPGAVDYRPAAAGR
jgi:hypothetical protein